jgi:hypothetical protein
MRPSHATAALAVISAMAMAPVSLAGPGTTAVNPAATPVKVVISVPTAQAITVRVIRESDSQVVATLGPVNAMVDRSPFRGRAGAAPGAPAPWLPTARTASRRWLPMA